MPKRVVAAKRAPKTGLRHAPIVPGWNQAELLAIDAWIAAQGKALTRAKAVRKLVGLALGAAQTTPDGDKPKRGRASRLAGREIDKVADTSASHAERTVRKQRLLQGPPEFREHRVDLPRRKP
jgi:hypothetical protein